VEVGAGADLQYFKDEFKLSSVNVSRGKKNREKRTCQLIRLVKTRYSPSKMPPDGYAKL